MALLEYDGLGFQDRTREVLSHSFAGVRDFYEFQKDALNFLREQRVFRVGWQRTDRRVDGPGHKSRSSPSEAVWVELVEPEGVPDPDALFDWFFDEDARFVFEDPDSAAQGSADSEMPPPDRRQARRRPPPQHHQIQVLRRDRDDNQLLLSRLPEYSQLLLWPNTTPLERQQEALKQLTDAPRPHHRPIVQLLVPNADHLWPSFSPTEIPPDGWHILTDAARPGTASQRSFVAKALATPDFAVLEGPPGSGKTTAICELILQIVRRPTPGRVLLCASTHVAVDNVLERLGDPSRVHSTWINALRIGDESKAGDAVKRFLPENRKATDREQLGRFLRSQPATDARRHLQDAISDEGLLTRFMLETSNVVCGTTIGILRLHKLLAGGGHREPRTTDRAELFDMLIIDEASKTTFQEFLVPALLAKRWALVGDPRQLSPYVDEELMQVGLESALPDPVARDACLDVFQARSDAPPMAARRGRLSPWQRPVLVVTEDSSMVGRYRRQSEARGVLVADIDADDPLELASAGVVLATPHALAAAAHALPPDLCRVRVDPRIAERVDPTTLDDVLRRIQAWRRCIDDGKRQEDEWSGQYAYRLVREYEQRFRVGGRAALIDAEGEPDPQDTPTRREQQLRAEQAQLRPVFLDEAASFKLAEGIDRVRRAALPSILESLQCGFATSARRSRPTALAIGLPPARFSERHVLLEHQHRMHPDIAVFPRDRVYGGKALATDDTMFRRRSWGFEADQPRARWLHVGAPCAGRKSTHEADLVISRVDRFVQWAKANPHHDEEGTPDGKPWEVAVLTFYRAQERLLRDRLRDESGQHYANHLFRVGPRERPVCTIRLCTVDRFQGQEADLVVISIANDHTTTFLESLNRLNVAITRARYLLLIVGNKQAMGRDRSHGTLIHELAHSKEIHFEGDLRERRRNGSH